MYIIEKNLNLKRKIFENMFLKILIILHLYDSYI